MKRFLVFGFDEHYPSGGWGDFFSSFDEAMQAVSYATQMIEVGVHVRDAPDLPTYVTHPAHGHIVDTRASEHDAIVWDSER